MRTAAITDATIKRSLELVANAKRVLTQEAHLLRSVHAKTTSLALGWLNEATTDGSKLTTRSTC